jgi:hypothetical protein
MARKTFRVSELVNEVNDRLALSTCGPDGRKGMCTVVEHVLMETGNYAGFMYLNQASVPAGHKPGIIHRYDPETGEPDHEFPDETRRFYFQK